MSDATRRFIIQRDLSLYAATIDRRGVHFQQRLVNISTLTPEYFPCIWAISPDGHQLAYTGVSDDPVQAEKDRVAPTPQTVYLADLPGATGKRRLFSTPHLRDRRGRPVKFDAFEWEINQLRWNHRGDRLYVAQSYHGNTIGYFMTGAVDARTGHAFTDALGNWQEVLPTSSIDESATGRLVGIGQGRTRDEKDVCNACSKYSPLYTVRGSGPPVSLLPGRFTSRKKPPYAFADGSAISPDGSRILLTVGNTLWLTWPGAPRYTHLLTLPKPCRFGNIAWLGSDTILYHRHDQSDDNQNSLWLQTLTREGSFTTAPRLLLRGIATFASFPNNF